MHIAGLRYLKGAIFFSEFESKKFRFRAPLTQKYSWFPLNKTYSLALNLCNLLYPSPCVLMNILHNLLFQVENKKRPLLKLSKY